MKKKSVLIITVFTLFFAVTAAFTFDILDNILEKRRWRRALEGESIENGVISILKDIEDVVTDSLNEDELLLKVQYRRKGKDGENILVSQAKFKKGERMFLRMGCHCSGLTLVISGVLDEVGENIVPKGHFFIFEKMEVDEKKGIIGKTGVKQIGIKKVPLEKNSPAIVYKVEGTGKLITYPDGTSEKVETWTREREIQFTATWKQ